MSSLAKAKEDSAENQQAEAKIRAYLAEHGISPAGIEQAVQDWQLQLPLHIDYESSSRTDLIKEGAWKYASCPSTEILMMGWAFGEDAVQLWWIWKNWRTPMPERVKARFLICALGYGRRLIHCHNAQFERWMTWFILCPEHDLPEPPIEAFYCTAAQARRRSLPGALDDLGRALGLKLQKDKRGRELIRFLSVPQADGTFLRDPGLMHEFGQYCLQDVRVERAAAQMSPELSDEEFEDFVVSEMINDAGLRVDVDFATAVQAYASEETAAINDELIKLTNGRVKTARSFPSIKDWMEPYREDNDVIRRATTRVKTVKGVEQRRVSMDKSARYNILAAEEEEPGTIPAPVLELVSLLDEAGRSSIHKYKAMVLRADPDDDRVRGAYLYCGASQTARFSSTGLQVHNFVRECAPDPEEVKRQVLAGEDLVMSAKKLERGEEETILDILASMLRPSIMAEEGMRLVWGDWAGIEARGLPWLARHPRAEEKLDIFRRGDAEERATGERSPENDPYRVAAAGIFGVPIELVDDEQRQIGKVAELSLGYAGGVRALLAMARAYKVRLTESQAEVIKVAWRQNNQWCVQYWKTVETAMMRAIRHPAQYFDAGRLRYISTEEPYPTLWCLLPSGSVLSYPMAEIVRKKKFGKMQDVAQALKANWKPKADDPGWPRFDLYGGLCTENGTQSIATSDILKAALRRLKEAEWPIVGTTHDEILLEVYADEVKEAREALGAAMLAREPWMEGLPLWVDLKDGLRYRK